MILMAVVAAVTAFVAKFPGVTLLILFGTAYVLIESGAIVEIVEYLAKPHVYARYPILATVVWIGVGLISFAISGCFVWLLFHAKDLVTFLLQLLIAVVSGAFGTGCGWLLWNSFKSPTNIESFNSPDN